MIPALTKRRLALAASICALVAAPNGAPAGSPVKPAVLCALQPGQTVLASGVRHGLAHHLRQYPDLSLATATERHAATRLLARLRSATRSYADVRNAARADFDTHLARRAPGDVTIGYLHAEHRRFSADNHVLDPRRPEALIYATEPGRRPRLVGAMFSVRRGVVGPTPGGAIDRWHSHLVCVRGDKRGLAPLQSGGCTPGATLTRGSEMLHVWFTSDLRSAFAVHAPVPELCRDGLLTPKACRSRGSLREM